MERQSLVADENVNGDIVTFDLFHLRFQNCISFKVSELYFLSNNYSVETFCETF